MERTRAGFLILGTLIMLIGGLFSLAAGVSLAQDAKPTVNAVASNDHPAAIYAGTCEAPRGVVESLSPLVAPAGSWEGPLAAVVAEMSYGTITRTLDELLSSDHLIVVHPSPAELDSAVVCGDIGGVRDEFGTLTIGLSDSGFTGIAFLVPVDDGFSTDVAIFVASPEAGSFDSGRLVLSAGPLVDDFDLSQDALATPEPGGFAVVAISEEVLPEEVPIVPEDAFLPGDSGTGSQD